MRSALCRLLYAASRIEACPREGCPFWEQGGAVLEGGCALERLELDLERKPELTDALLEVRRMLERARTREEEQEARRLFRRLLPRGLRE